jgi:hypothetical protein
MLLSCVKKANFAYCWVIVEPPTLVPEKIFEINALVNP